MHELLEAVKAWPVIVQGALGSALFWLILLAAQKITAIVSEAYSRHSTTARRSWLITTELKYSGAISGDVEEQARNATMLIYRSLRFLYKGIMWLTLGIAVELTLEISGIIGYAGCIYYILQAYSVVAPIDPDEDWHKRLDNIRKELSELEQTRAE
ncbi:hypothetical protein D3C78_1161990 [compost metagenome]